MKNYLIHKTCYKSLTNLILLPIALLAGHWGSAATIIWENPNGGDFSLGSNWTGGVAPDETDTASFKVGGDYTVDFNEDIKVHAVYEGDVNQTEASNVTLNLNGYSLTSEVVASNAGIILTSTQAEIMLRLINGEVSIANLRIHNGTKGDVEALHTLEVGSGATLNLLSDIHEYRVGNGGKALLKVSSGGILNVDNTLQVGRQGSEATVWIDGGVVSFNPEGIRRELRLAASEAGTTGELIIENGGKVEGIGSLGIGHRASAESGRAVVTGAGSYLEASAIYVGGRATTAGSVGLLSVVDGGAVQINTTLRVYEIGTILLEGGVIEGNNAKWDENSTLGITLLSENDPQLLFSGDVILENSLVNLVLSLEDGFSGSAGSVYTLLNYEGTLSGQFKGLEEGSLITLDNHEFELSYGAGTMDAITLTMIPESKSYFGIIGILLIVFCWKLKRAESVS